MTYEFRLKDGSRDKLHTTQKTVTTAKLTKNVVTSMYYHRWTAAYMAQVAENDGEIIKEAMYHQAKAEALKEVAEAYGDWDLIRAEWKRAEEQGAIHGSNQQYLEGRIEAREYVRENLLRYSHEKWFPEFSVVYQPATTFA